jgi:hypothetical protein
MNFSYVLSSSAFAELQEKVSAAAQMEAAATRIIELREDLLDAYYRCFITTMRVLNDEGDEVGTVDEFDGFSSYEDVIRGVADQFFDRLLLSTPTSDLAKGTWDVEKWALALYNGIQGFTLRGVSFARVDAELRALFPPSTDIVELCSYLGDLLASTASWDDPDDGGVGLVISL